MKLRKKVAAMRVSLDRLRRVQEVIGKNLNSSVSRGFTTSITQHQFAREECREGKSAGSNEPRHNKLEKHAQNSVSTSGFTSTASLEPRANAHPECFTLYSVSRVR